MRLKARIVAQAVVQGTPRWKGVEGPELNTSLTLGFRKLGVHGLIYKMGSVEHRVFLLCEKLYPQILSKGL